MEISPEMIQRIKAEVRKVVSQQGMASPPPDRRVLAIFDATEAELSISLEQLAKCVESGYVITVILSDLASKLLDISLVQATCGAQNVFISGEITNLQPFTEGFSAIVIPVLSYSLSAKLALGLADTPGAYLAFQALLRGDVVIATSEVLQSPVESKRPPAMSKLGQNYMRTLSSFGVRFVASDQLSETILSGATVDSSSTGSTQRQNIISAAVITSLAPGTKEFVYANPAIITPLARDLAAQKGIRLIAQKRGR